MRPLGDRVMIEAVKVDDMDGRIIIPDTAKGKSQEGIVIAVGPGKFLECGTLRPMSVTVGDRILYSKYSPVEIEYCGDEYLIVHEDDILLVIDQR